MRAARNCNTKTYFALSDAARRAAGSIPGFGKNNGCRYRVDHLVCLLHHGRRGGEGLIARLHPKGRMGHQAQCALKPFDRVVPVNNAPGNDEAGLW